MYNYNYSYNYGPSIDDAALAMMIIPILAVAVLVFIAWCRILAKANRNWWGMFIPFYGSYLTYEIAGVPGFFWTTLICSIVSSVLTAIAPGIGGFLTAVTAILSLVLSIIHCVKLSKAFGHGGGFAVGLIFLGPIFLMILGFGSSNYEG